MNDLSFLIVKMSAIGDCVMAVPVVSAIRRTYADAFIAWAVEPRCAAVIDTERLVDLRYEVPRPDWKKRHTFWWIQYRHFARLRRFNFTYGIDLQGHTKTACCLRIANPKHRLAANAVDLAARALNPVAEIDRKIEHRVERYLKVLDVLGDFCSNAEPIMPRVEQLPCLPAAADISRLVTISVAAGHPRKCYSLAQWKQVASHFIESGLQVAFLGGPSDPKPDMPPALDWVGKLPLAATVAAVAQSKLHLAADTGTGHIAAAYGVPVVSVFGHTKPSVFRPYTSNGIVLDAGRKMQNVHAADIIQAAGLMLKSQSHAFLN